MDTNSSTTTQSAERTHSMPSGASLDFAGVCRLLGLNPDTTTVAAVNRLAKEKTDPKPKFTTAAQARKYEDFLGEGKSFVRKGDKDRRLHRIVHFHPRFTGVTGEEAIMDPDTKQMVVYAVYVFVVEAFEEKEVMRMREGGISIREKARVPVGDHFNIEADRFLEEYQQA